MAGGGRGCFISRRAPAIPHPRFLFLTLFIWWSLDGNSFLLSRFQCGMWMLKGRGGFPDSSWRLMTLISFFQLWYFFWSNFLLSFPPPCDSDSNPSRLMCSSTAVHRKLNRIMRNSLVTGSNITRKLYTSWNTRSNGDELIDKLASQTTVFYFSKMRVRANQ